MPGQNVAGAAASGDRRVTLEAMRDHLAQAMDESTPNVAANIAGQLRQVLAELEEITEPERSAVDDLARRRSARRGAGTDAPADTAGRKQVRR